MERFFAALSKRQTMMLLTAVTFGGNEGVAALDFLPPDEAELLKHRANEMLQIPREKRIPLLAQEIKRLVTARRGVLWSADPESLAAALRKERSALVEVVLKALPASVGVQVRALLPGRESVTLKKEVKPEVLSIVRWKLEELLGRRRGAFKFSDVLILQARELLTVCDRMGARALATSIAGLSDSDREAFLKALPPDQRNLAARAAEAGIQRKLPEADAKATLEVHDALKNPSQGMRSAGTQRLARACLAQSPELAARLLERHPGDFGRLLQKWVKEERARPVTRGDGGRADIVEQMERLAQKGIVDRPMRLPPPKHPAPLAAAPAVASAKPAQPPAKQGAAPLPGGKLLPPPPRPGVPTAPGRAGEAPPASGQPPRRPLLAPPPPRVGARPDADQPRRDFMAERAARSAGATSARPGSDPRGDPVGENVARRAGSIPTGERRPPPDTDPRAPMPAEREPPPEPRRRDPQQASPVAKRDPAGGARVLRDGKPREPSKDETLPPKGRAQTSPALQGIPRLKGGTASGAQAGRPSRPVTGARSVVLKGSNRGPKDGSG